MIEIRPIQPEQAIDLRHRVLRPHLPVEKSRYPDDDHPETRCFGLIEGNVLRAICSFHPEPHPQLGLPLRLRGMAVEPELQGRGYGRLLLQESLAQLRPLGLPGIWCNARTSALNFYQKLGFAFWGDEFEIPEIGPHVVAYYSFQ